MALAFPETTHQRACLSVLYWYYSQCWDKNLWTRSPHQGIRKIWLLQGEPINIDRLDWINKRIMLDLRFTLWCMSVNKTSVLTGEKVVDVCRQLCNLMNRQKRNAFFILLYFCICLEGFCHVCIHLLSSHLYFFFLFKQWFIGSYSRDKAGLSFISSCHKSNAVYLSVYTISCFLLTQITYSWSKSPLFWDNRTGYYENISPTVVFNDGSNSTGMGSVLCGARTDL